MHDKQENRYRVEPIGLSGAYGAVICGTGSMSVYQGHLADCEKISLLLQGAFNDGRYYAIPFSVSEAQPVGQLPELPEATIEGSVMHQELKICYWTVIHYTADQMRAYGQACAEAARQPAPVLTDEQIMKLRVCIETCRALEILSRIEADNLLSVIISHKE